MLNDDRSLQRFHAPALAEFTYDERVTMLSADDAVKHCYEAGYCAKIASSSK